MGRPFDTSRLRGTPARATSGNRSRTVCLAWLLAMHACTPAPADPRAGAPAGTRPPPPPASAPPAPPDAGTTSTDAGDVTASAADADAPTDGGVCSPPPATLAATCSDVLMSYASGTPVRCDAGFHARHTRFIHCKPGDLMCAVRSAGWDHAPIYQAAPPDQIADCLSECRAGNGASCARITKTLTTAIPTANATASVELRGTCADHFQREACRFGLPYSCGDQSPCPDLVPDRRQAFAALEKQCDPKRASWACFYVAHSVEMLWGASASTNGKASYASVCAAGCPAAPERCYKAMACEVFRQR
jgi:hypothetical protein